MMQMAAAWQRQEVEIERIQVRQVASPEPERAQMPTRNSGAASGSVLETRPGGEEKPSGLSPDDRLYLLKALLERLTGRPIRLPDQAPQAADPAPGPTIDHSEPELEIQYQRIRVVQEVVSFQAAGTVRTADGTSIRFQFAFALARSELTLEQGTIHPGRDPLVLDFLNQGGQLSEQTIPFDLYADGSDHPLPVPASGRGYLVIDRNENGRVDDGRELFGPTSGDGFRELARLDHDGNQWIDEADPDFRNLALWRPGQDPVPLSQAGIGALFTGNVQTPWSTAMGQIRTTGLYLGENGLPGTISRLDLYA